MMNYRHTQMGWAILVPILLVLATILVLVEFSVKSGRTIPLAVFGLLTVTAVLFATLSVTVHGEWLECRFGPGLIRRRIRLTDVQRAEAVRNKWYYGWGIRLTPYGWLWNVSGLDAVELTFANGKKFRIGTDEPDRLLEAIRSGANRLSPPP